MLYFSNNVAATEMLGDHYMLVGAMGFGWLNMSLKKLSSVTAASVDYNKTAFLTLEGTCSEY